MESIRKVLVLSERQQFLQTTFWEGKNGDGNFCERLENNAVTKKFDTHRSASEFLFIFPKVEETEINYGQQS